MTTSYAYHPDLHAQLLRLGGAWRELDLRFGLGGKLKAPNGPGIYALADNDSKNPFRYVGAAGNLKKRLAQHKYGVKFGGQDPAVFVKTLRPDKQNRIARLRQVRLEKKAIHQLKPRLQGSTGGEGLKSVFRPQVTKAIPKAALKAKLTKGGISKRPVPQGPKSLLSGLVTAAMIGAVGAGVISGACNGYHYYQGNKSFKEAVVDTSMDAAKGAAIAVGGAFIPLLVTKT